MHNETPQLDILLDRLPHKPPMRLLDSVIEASPTRAVCAAEMDTRKAALFGDGHGGIRSLIGVELIAQAAAVALASEAAGALGGGRLAMVRSFSCERASFEVGPAARVEAEMQESVEGTPFSIVAGSISQGGERICQATLLLAHPSA